MTRLLLALALGCAACSTTPPTAASTTATTQSQISAAETAQAAAIVPGQPVAAPAPAASSNPLAQLNAIAIPDLAAAVADANAQSPPDTIAATCYAYLQGIVASGQAASLTQPVGVFSAFQKGRDGVRSIKNGISDAAFTACAPLVMSATTDVTQLINQVMGLVTTGALLTPK